MTTAGVTSRSQQKGVAASGEKIVKKGKNRLKIVSGTNENIKYPKKSGSQIEQNTRGDNRRGSEVNQNKRRA